MSRLNSTPTPTPTSHKNADEHPNTNTITITNANHGQPLWEWSARIRFNKNELGSSFSVCLFLGEPPTDPEEWLTAPNFAGAHHAFVSSAGGGSGYGYGGRSRTRPGGGGGGVNDEGFVVLNPPIARLSGLGSFDPEVVVPYLTEKLQWKVQKTNTEPAELKSLQIVVFATPLSYLPGEMFPVPGEPRLYEEITRGKAGGC